MINITLPDGSIRQAEANATAMDVARDISEGLARNVLVHSRERGDQLLLPDRSGSVRKLPVTTLEISRFLRFDSIDAIFRIWP